MDPRTRYGVPMMEVPWRHGRHRPEQVYAQHGPLPDDADAWVCMCSGPEVAGYLIRLHNAAVKRLARRSEGGAVNGNNLLWTVLLVLLIIIAVIFIAQRV